MHMDVPGVVFAVEVGTYERLMAGEVLFGKFHTKGLGFFSGEVVFCGVLRIKA